MRTQRKEIKKPNSERVRYALTELTEQEYKTICKGLEALTEDKKAAEMLATLKEVATLEFAELLNE